MPPAELYWKYLQNTQAIIFVVDSNDRDCMGEARYELHRMLNADELQQVTLLVLAHKQDLPTAMSTTEVADRLGLHTLRHRSWFIAGTGNGLDVGLDEGLHWLSRNLSRCSE